jgi:hypothetical protein
VIKERTNMAKHSIGDKFRHSRMGDGEIVKVQQETRTPPPIDKVKLDGELWNLRARIAEIQQIIARGDTPELVDVYTVEFVNAKGKKRTETFDEYAVTVLKERPPEPDPEAEAAALPEPATGG